MGKEKERLIQEKIDYWSNEIFELEKWISKVSHINTCINEYNKILPIYRKIISDLEAIQNKPTNNQ